MKATKLCQALKIKSPVGLSWEKEKRRILLEDARRHVITTRMIHSSAGPIINGQTGNTLAAEISRGMAHRSSMYGHHEDMTVRVRLGHVGLYCSR